MSPELLTYLNAKVQHFAMAPGGIPHITSEDISHILGKIGHVEACQYARLKYTGRTGLSDNVARSLRREIRIIKGSEGWRVPRKDFLLDLCALALSESLDDRLCPDCRGRAGGMINSRYVVCGPCKGTGKRKIYDKDRAELMGLSKSSWSDTWNPRYRKIQELIDRWEDVFFTGLNKHGST